MQEVDYSSRIVWYRLYSQCYRYQCLIFPLPFLLSWDAFVEIRVLLLYVDR